MNKNNSTNLKYLHDSQGRFLEIYLTGSCFYTVHLINDFNKYMAYQLSDESSQNKRQLAENMRDTFAYIQAKIEPFIDIQAPLSININDGEPVIIVRLLR